MSTSSARSSTWEQAAVGQTTAARMHAVRAARIAHQSGMDAVEMSALEFLAYFNAGRISDGQR